MAHNLSNIILKQQIQGTMASSRSNTLVNFSVGKNFAPAITGGASSPEGDVIYAFKATASGSSGETADNTVTLDFPASTTAYGGSGTPIITNRAASGSSAQLQLDAEGNTVSTLHASNGRIVSVFCYTNPNEHRGNITIEDSGGSKYVPKFTFVTGGSQVKSLLFTPRVAPSGLDLQITFTRADDELNVVVLGESS